MITPSGEGATIEEPPTRPCALVWIDAREAAVVRRRDDRVVVEHALSHVPPHRRGTGHVRHDPSVRHGGGGGSPQDAGEPRRLEHLERFVTGIAERLPPDDDLQILGPGTVRHRLRRILVERDRHHGRHRAIRCEASTPLTDRQLIARLHAFEGVEPRRYTVGSHRWDEPLVSATATSAPLPRRIGEKPTRERP